MAYRVTVEGVTYQMDIEEIDGQKQKFLIRHNDTERVVEAFSSSLSLYTLLVKNQSFDVCLSNGKSPPSVSVNGQYFSVGFERNLEPIPRKRPKAKATGPADLIAGMPGKIVKILVKNGDKVEKGQPLLILEAMKMENELTSPQHGIVQSVHVKTNQSVENGQKLATILTS